MALPFFVRAARALKLTSAAVLVTGALAIAPTSASAAGSGDDGAGLWSAAPRPTDQQLATHDVDIDTVASRPLTLDAGGMAGLLATAPAEFGTAARSAASVVALPSPSGGFEHFSIQETALMAPGLAAKFPEITTYVGQGIDDPTASVRLDQGPLGFHAQILTPKGTWYIDPLYHLDDSVYVSYYRADLINTHGDFTDGDLPGEVARAEPAIAAAPRNAGATLRTYRLAVTTTNEYSAQFGNTPASVLAEVVRAVNRVTGIYQIELDVRLQLIADENKLIFTTTDDGINNSDVGVAISQNQTVTDSIIGDAGYDVGHIFTTSAGGLAGLGVVGVTGQKAQGVTGLPNPTGDAYWIDYVAHEMGHEFSGNHTFNGSQGSCSGNDEPSASMEPGSGTTIMAYAGICGSDDLQSHFPLNSSDPYFHAKSFDEIEAVISRAGQGGTASATGNNVPTVSSVGGATFAIPPQTPFALTALGDDADGDALTYGWEQYDGTPTARPLSAQPKPDGALFRSFTPTTSPVRYFPSLANIALGKTNAATGNCPALPGGLACLSEYLPTTPRTMHFRGTVRDNRVSAGGVNNTDVTVNVAGATPFTVASPNGGGSSVGGAAVLVTWNVAGTTGAPYSATNVDILLSTDGGSTFPITLSSGTPNDGSQSVTIANIATTQARIMVRANPGIFFDTSDANFTITAGTTPAVPSAPGQPTAVSSAARQATVTWTAPASIGGAELTGYIVTASPGGKTCSAPAAALTCTVTGLAAGTYTFTVKATNVGGSGPDSAATAAVAVAGPPPVVISTFVPLVPGRLMETRSGLSTVDGQFNNLGQLAARSVTALVVSGRSGVASDASAVVLNVTVTETTDAGFVTVFPCGSTQPNASSLNYTSGQTVANAVITKVGDGGKVCFFTTAALQLVVDVTGEFSATASYVPLVPARLLESRQGMATVDSVSNGIGTRPTGSTTELVVGGRGGVAPDAASVVLNVTVTGPQDAGFITVFPCGSDRPNASSVNYVAGQTVPNAVISKVGPGGKVCLYTSAATDLLADVTGYFPATSPFTSVVPARLLESRSGMSTVDGVSNSIGTRPIGSTTELVVAGRGNVPISATAVVLNVTVTGPQDAGFITVYPCDTDRPNASSVNYVAGQTVPNAVISKVSADGKVCLYTTAATDLLTDVTGYFVAG
ncbi:MAG: type sorting protein [Ilumatobacteraceae bacterium]|nr:type sorting protein [Ilumatobacteraceae bacterium]